MIPREGAFDGQDKQQDNIRTGRLSCRAARPTGAGEQDDPASRPADSVLGTRSAGLNSPRLGLWGLEAALSAACGRAVQLLQVPLQASQGFLVAPVDRQALSEPFWQAVRASPSAGVWNTPEEAVVCFAAGIGGWRSATARPIQTRAAIERYLRDLLAGGAEVAVKDVEAAVHSVQRSWSQVKRAAERLGVVKRKAGMQGGWLWSLPRPEGGTKNAKRPLHLGLCPSASSQALLSPAAAPAGRRSSGAVDAETRR